MSPIPQTLNEAESFTPEEDMSYLLSMPVRGQASLNFEKPTYDGNSIQNLMSAANAVPVSEQCYLEREHTITSEEYLLERIAKFEGKIEALKALKPNLYEAIAGLGCTDQAASAVVEETENLAAEQPVDVEEENGPHTPESELEGDGDEEEPTESGS